MADDVTVEILKNIRDAVRGTNERLDATNQRLDATNQRLDAGLAKLYEELQRLRLEMHERDSAIELRQATRIVAQTAATRDLYDKLIGQQELRERIEQCEREIDELKKRSS